MKIQNLSMVISKQFYSVAETWRVTVSSVCRQIPGLHPGNQMAFGNLQ